MQYAILMIILQKFKGERYRFKIVVLELEHATMLEYQVAILAFINCLIISTSDLVKRVRIRNELIGMYFINFNYLFGITSDLFIAQPIHARPLQEVGH